jgi:hypothetical protein
VLNSRRYRGAMKLEKETHHEKAQPGDILRGRSRHRHKGEILCHNVVAIQVKQSRPKGTASSPAGGES